MYRLIIAILILLYLWFISYNTFFYVNSKRLAQEKQMRLNIPSETRRKILIELYNFTCMVASISNTKPFLIYGTLLGQYRSNDLICYDFDLDYGIIESEYDNLYETVKSIIHDRPDLTITEYPYLKYIGAKFFQIYHSSGLNIDICVFKSHNDNNNNNNNNNNNTISRCYPKWYLKKAFGERQTTWQYTDCFPLTAVTFLGQTTYIPCNPTVFLESWYGPTYMTPDTICNCPRCQKLNNSIRKRLLSSK